MKNILYAAIWSGLIFACTGTAFAHHNTQAEFGSFASDTVYVEAEVTKVQWGNPHIIWEVVVTAGDLPAGEKLRVLSHPVNVQEEYGFAASDFAVGDRFRLLAWTHLRGVPMMWPRAVAVNDGPMRSNLRYTDMIDIANGSFAELNIVPPTNLQGSAPGRAGPEAAAKLQSMGLLDDRGLMIWPPRP